jgi:ABC-type transport system substrate-binding protein
MYSPVEARAPTKYNHPKTDELIQQGRIESDTAKRKEIYCNIEQLISDDAILTMPIRLVRHMIASKKVQNVTPPRRNVVLVRDARSGREVELTICIRLASAARATRRPAGRPR